MTTNEWKKVQNYRYSHLHSHNQPGNKYFGPNYNNQESGKKQFINNIVASPITFKSRNDAVSMTLMCNSLC